MEIFSIDKISIFIIFFIPGFISMKVYQLIVPSENDKWSDRLFEAISFSCLNFGLLFWLFNLIYDPDFYSEQPVLYHLGMWAALVILPALYPFILNTILEFEWLGKWIQKTTPTAWDRYFKRKQPCWVIIHMKNGKRIGGLFMKESYASAFPSPPDIYIYEAWEINEEGGFSEKIPQTNGLWVSKDSIGYLEFFKLNEEVKTCEQKSTQ